VDLGPGGCGGGGCGEHVAHRHPPQLPHPHTHNRLTSPLSRTPAPCTPGLPLLALRSNASSPRAPPPYTPNRSTSRCRASPPSTSPSSTSSSLAAWPQTAPARCSPSSPSSSPPSSTSSSQPRRCVAQLGLGCWAPGLVHGLPSYWATALLGFGSGSLGLCLGCHATGCKPWRFECLFWAAGLLVACRAELHSIHYENSIQ